MNEIDKIFENRLKSKIADLPIEKLLVEMNNNNYYFPYNIWKNFFDRNSIEGGKQISWFATRQAEKINDKNHSEKLKAIIENKNSKAEIKNSAYFCLGHIAKNIKNKELFEFLINKLDSESEENQQTILIALTNAKKPNGYNLTPIINILKNGKMGMKINAAISLKNSENPEIETELLNSFQKEKNKHLQEMIAATLRTIGTDKSIPILENKLKTAKGGDYKYFLESALTEIKNRTNTTANSGYAPGGKSVFG